MTNTSPEAPVFGADRYGMLVGIPSFFWAVDEDVLNIF